MVYVAGHWGLALTYPMHETSHQDIPYEKGWVISPLGVNAGTVPSVHLTNPVRVILRLLYTLDHRLWFKIDGKENWNNQSAFPVGVEFISHVYIIGVHSDLVPRSLPYVGLQPLQRDLYQESKHAHDGRFARADRSRIEIPAVKVALILRHHSFSPYSPKPLTAGGDFADGSPRVWTPELREALIARPGAFFKST